MITSAVRALVVARAGNRCEYCRLPQDGYEATFHVDHVIANQHRKVDDDANLSLCCPQCNRKKGPNLAGIDPITQVVVPLFHPRLEIWLDHFRWNGPLIVGISPSGRATVAVLDINAIDRVRLRQSLMVEGLL